MAEERIQFDPHEGWPKGPDVIYHCIQCFGTVPSQPTEDTHCICGNLFVTAGGGKVETWAEYEVDAYRTL